MPANFGRTDGAARPRRRRRRRRGTTGRARSQTAAMPARSSMTPRLVVPAVATTANRPSSPRSARAASSASPVMRPRVVGGDAEHVDVHHLGGGDDRRVRLVGGGQPQPAGRARRRARPGRRAGRRRAPTGCRRCRPETKQPPAGRAARPGRRSSAAPGSRRRSRPRPRASCRRRSTTPPTTRSNSVAASVGAAGDERQVAGVVDRHGSRSRAPRRTGAARLAAEPERRDRLARGRARARPACAARRAAPGSAAAGRARRPARPGDPLGLVGVAVHGRRVGHDGVARPASGHRVEDRGDVRDRRARVDHRRSRVMISPSTSVGVTSATPSATSARSSACSRRPPSRSRRMQSTSGRARSRARGRAAARCRRRLPGHGQRALDGVGVGARPVGGEREPERQAAGPPGEVDGVVGRVPVARRRGRRPGSRRAGGGPPGPARAGGRAARSRRTARRATCAGRR